MTPWTWWAGEIDDDTYGLAEAATREDAIREASQCMKPGEKFRIVEARASTAARYEGSDCVPFLRTRNHEIITVGPVDVTPSPQSNMSPHLGARLLRGYENAMAMLDMTDKPMVSDLIKEARAAFIDQSPAPQDHTASRETFAKSLFWELENHDRCPPEARGSIRRHKTVRLIMQRLEEALTSDEATPQAIAEEKQPDQRHDFVPNKKFPWFCACCGYAPHEPLKHFQRD